MSPNLQSLKSAVENSDKNQICIFISDFSKWLHHPYEHLTYVLSLLKPALPFCIPVYNMTISS